MYDSRMHWIHAHRLAIGILADSLTLAGGLVLTRDALGRLKDLKKNRVDVQFSKEFPLLRLTDEEFKSAVVAVRWAVTGFVLILLGFLVQLILRIEEG
jgi:hypothetical protein